MITMKIITIILVCTYFDCSIADWLFESHSSDSLKQCVAPCRIVDTITMYQMIFIFSQCSTMQEAVVSSFTRRSSRQYNKLKYGRLTV